MLRYYQLSSSIGSGAKYRPYVGVDKELLNLHNFSCTEALGISQNISSRIYENMISFEICFKVYWICTAINLLSCVMSYPNLLGVYHARYLGNI